MTDAVWLLETPRLAIRRVEPDDADTLFAIRATMPFDPPKRDLAAMRAMCAEMAAKKPGTDDGWHQFSLVEHATHRLIGDIGVNVGHPGPRQAEIGFAVAEDLRGRGFASEAVEQIVTYLFGLGLHRLTALTDVRNIPTQRLLARLGFRVEGRFIASWPQDDAWYDEVFFARLASE